MDYLDRIPDEEPETEITALLKELAAHRAKAAELKETWDKKMQDFQKDNKALHDLYDWEKLKVQELEERVREAALLPNAQNPDSVKVKTFKEVVFWVRCYCPG